MLFQKQSLILSFIYASALFLTHSAYSEDVKPNQAKPFAIAIHGGAGTIKRENLSQQQDQGIRKALKNALDAGYDILASGGSSRQAIIKAIMLLEDSPYFNAAKGAVYTYDKTHELDASIMDGKTLNAGAISGVKRIKNPILLAELVMEQSPHVMLSGDGAEEFAKQYELEFVDPSYFGTPFRLEQLEKLQQRERRDNAMILDPGLTDHKFGTVGAVALDQDGNLAAGTSTGGMTNKRFGRIGDAPIIGAGTYANNQSCAVSATGHGEYFIRYTVAHDICARKQYLNLSLKQAADQVIMDVLVKAKGAGGIIAVDKEGNVALPFNTSGMYRGFRKNSGKAVVKIYQDED